MMNRKRMTACLLAFAMALGCWAQAEEIPERTAEHTAMPNAAPTPEPTAELTQEPTAEPTPEPTAEPTQEPTAAPTPEPTAESTQEPTLEPTAEPTQEPTLEPTAEPTQEPTTEPTTEPTQEPTTEPTQEPTLEPTAEPTQEPTAEPSDAPTPEPTPWIPRGQAYTTLSDGTQLDGGLQAILVEMAARGEAGTVYLLTTDNIRVSGVSQAFVESVRFTQDPHVFCDPDMIYAVEIQVQESSSQTVIQIQLTATDKNAPTAEPVPTQQPTAEPTAVPVPTATPKPAMTISVSAQDYKPGVWSNALPMFTLSGIPQGDRAYMYGVFICDERLVILSDGRNTYAPEQDGSVSLRFVILDTMGDLVSVSDQYDMLLDFTPPDGPYIMRLEYTDTVVQIGMDDDLSGVAEISMNFGQTWQKPDDPQYLMGEKDSKIYEGQILLRDAAGNVSKNYEEHQFAPETPRYYGFYGQKRIKHVPETLDYSTANYNALELNFSSEPQFTLTAGDTQLNLSLADEDGEPLAFTAALTGWETETGDGKTKNVLLLSAVSVSGMNVWRFTGDAYRLLANSGVEYIVFASGDYIAAIPTQGFTGGTAYGKLKAAGVSTRKFAYTLCQDEMLRETVLSTEVEGETYLLEEDTAKPMYRYDVLVGTRSLMDKPYQSYLNPEEDSDDTDDAR